MDVGYWANIALLIFGFGFVIFWHELGHFLAAKWAGVKVEQFAIGFGHAALCWRKGIGFTAGTSAAKARDLAAQGRTDIGETEYRLNWIPLGGYVKMLGQDDMNPGVRSADPRAYTSKPVGRRMVIVSAGVVMNVLLAAALFFGLFVWGIRVPPPEVGHVLAGSPAADAGFRSGDRIVAVNGHAIHDFQKIRLHVALSAPQKPIDVTVLRAGAETPSALRARPRMASDEPGGLPTIGILPTALLAGPDARTHERIVEAARRSGTTPQTLPVGTRVVAIDGRAADAERDYARLIEALGDGRPVALTLADAGGATLDAPFIVRPRLALTYDGRSPTFAGMHLRVTIDGINADSSARERLRVGDVVRALGVGDAAPEAANLERLRSRLRAAGESGEAVRLLVERAGDALEIDGLRADLRLEGLGVRGLGVTLGLDEENPVVGYVEPGSAAAAAGVAAGDRILSVDGSAVSNWFEVRRALAGAAGRGAVRVDVRRGEASVPVELAMTEAEAAQVAQVAATHDLQLPERLTVWGTRNPLTAMAWGVTETRDMVAQAYLVLRRMIEGAISPKNLTGPVGIVDTGTILAERGSDTLLRYIAMISANLAVVNFLPIPIVDGGLFLFLVWEKLRGRPPSARMLNIAQGVGLVLILSVFLFVTYHDVLRLLSRVM